MQLHRLPHSWPRPIPPHFLSLCSFSGEFISAHAFSILYVFSQNAHLLVSLILCVNISTEPEAQPMTLPKVKLSSTFALNHPVYLLTMLSVSMIHMQTCDPHRPPKKKSAVCHCPILLFLIVFPPSTNYVQCYSLKIPGIFDLLFSFMTSAVNKSSPLPCQLFGVMTSTQ